GRLNSSNPAAPLAYGSRFACKERRDEPIIRISIVPGLAARLNLPVKTRCPRKPLVSLRGNCFAGACQRHFCLNAEFPGKQVVVKCLLAIAAVLRELRED